MNSRNLRLMLAYDGTDFHGWQRQAGVRTVQEEIEHTLQRVLRHPVRLHGASRTDAGVHAHGQVASVSTTATIPTDRLGAALGHHFPPDIALVHVAHVPLTFHASRSAQAKLYRYRIYNARPRPTAQLLARYAWHVWHPLDLDRLRAAAALLRGTHDFAGFASQGSPRQTTVRTVQRVEIRRRQHEVLVDVAGTGFLYNQVRNMVGTLYEIGRGHWPPERVCEILASGDRRLAGPTAPAHGLCLQWVRYAAVAEVTDGPH